jgi:hypothetical protein
MFLVICDLMNPKVGFIEFLKTFIDLLSECVKGRMLRSIQDYKVAGPFLVVFSTFEIAPTGFTVYIDLTIFLLAS